MREILFRGQTRRKGERIINVRGDKCDSNWVYGGIFPQNNGGDFAIIYQQTPEIKKYTVYADTVGQYTGLTDKNGVKIFEGDIVRAITHSTDIYVEAITFENGAFWYKNWSWLKFRFKFENVEVIGNIYDNPELIEAKDD